MVYQRYEIGIEAVDRILGGGIPSGSVLTLIGEPGTGRMDLAMRFISKGFEINEPGLFVSFTSVPVTGYLKRLRGRAPFRALLETDEPLFLSTLELKGLDLVLGIIEEGAVGRLVLDRPEVLGMRNIQNWFKNLEDILIKARTIGMGTMMIAGPDFRSLGDYTSEGLLEMAVDSEGRRSANLRKWPFSEGGKVRESEVGEWVR